jgi:hypothetical protein
MKNNYGNYVVQKALKLCSGQLKAKMISIIVKSIEQIGDKKLIMKWKSIVNMHVTLGSISSNSHDNIQTLSSPMKGLNNAVGHNSFENSSNTSQFSEKDVFSVVHIHSQGKQFKMYEDNETIPEKTSDEDAEENRTSE